MSVYFSINSLTFSIYSNVDIHIYAYRKIRMDIGRKKTGMSYSLCLDDIHVVL